MRSSPRPGDPHLKSRLLTTLASLGSLTLALGCGPRVEPAHASKAHVARPVSPRPAPPPKPSELDEELAMRLRVGVEYTPWHDLGGWARYMAPEGDFVGDDGGVDVAFQFHGAEVAERDWRQSGLNAIIVSVTYPGWGTVPYKSGFSDPIRVGAILDDALRRVGATHVRRLLLVSWSAGYAAMGIALGNAHYYALADTAIILDGMHADLIDGKPDERAIAIFERYARDAVAGNKTMVVVHSSIVPPGYASTTQMADLLCASVGARRIEEERLRGDGMVEWYHTDAGGLHVRGYRGGGPKDHLDQLHLVDDLVREFVAPRWTRLALQEARQHPGTSTP
ncbi:MAG: hypothetical protein ACLQVI_22990 [Polyangiaceae bacterium]